MERYSDTSFIIIPSFALTGRRMHCDALGTAKLIRKSGMNDGNLANVSRGLDGGRDFQILSQNGPACVIMRDYC